MAIVQSFGVLTKFQGAASWPSSTSVSLYEGTRADYGTLYRTQPNVRTVVDFLARNIAQLGVHVFQRTSETDRVRVRAHGLSALMTTPNPYTTRYRQIESTMQDLGVYFNAFWVKVRVPNQLAVVRLPAGQMSVGGGLFPTSYTWTPPNGDAKTFAPSEIVHFSGYDPSNPLLGLSPLETLRRVLAEESAAGTYRENYWKTGAHIAGIISRPKDAPKWVPETKDLFRKQWREKFAGPGKAGGTPILEDGMTYVPTTFNSKDSEYLSSRKLTREEVAAAFHVPLPMVGILEHATFSNIKEQHKHLYQDCLGPWLVMVEEEIERQVLPEFAETEGIYVEFNIQEKLKGSFEEQTDSLYRACGGPFMTVDEARARLNLPSLNDPENATIRTVANITGAPVEAPVDEGDARALSLVRSA